MCAQCHSCLSFARRSCPASPSRCLSALIVGPLGLGSPRIRFNAFGAVPAVLYVATTAFVRPGWFAFRSRPVPWVDALCFVFPPACAGVGSFTVRVEQYTPGCCWCRSPALRLSLPRRREALPSSRITPLKHRPRSQTPVVSRPACAGLGSSADCVGQQTPGCWLRRSPSFRRLLPRRREALPSSRVTPLITCPALRPRWCPLRLP